MIGTRIGGRYEIVRNIGDGGMSKVYLAHDVILDRDVAIKVLNYDFANEEALKRRFKREALSATSLTHPHIVDIFDVGEEDELHYLVMEYIEGQTLKKFIQDNGALTPKQALPIMQQIVSAIANAHHNGIVHRDVKPQNILMDSDGDVKITDFGIAMALSATAHTKTNSVIGTVHYLSPEQARGGMATKKSDIYSLGIVLYELLSGELPFTADTAVAIALKHLQEETPSVRMVFPSIPQSLENVILKATMKDATYRYDSADEMYDDLLTVLSPERANENKFAIVFDDDRTRAIPIVSETTKFDSVETTKKIEPIQLEQSPPTPPKKRKKWPFIVGGIAGIAILILLLSLIPGLLGPKKAVIPIVAGMEEAEARDALEKNGFQSVVSEEQQSDEVKEGEVIKTIPEAGKKRDVDSEITLYISSGKEKSTLADYIGDNADEVMASLNDTVFKSIDSIEEFSDKPKGTIIGQEPDAGEVILSETDLLFTVSKGPELLILEDLRGYDKDRLADYEQSSGLTIDTVREDYSSTVSQGSVISQTPNGKTEIEKGGTVKVVVSKGPEKKPDKLVVKKVTIEYVPDVIEPSTSEETGDEGEEEGEGDNSSVVEQPAPIPQLIQIYIQDKNNKITDVYEEFSITETTEKSISFNLEEGQTGSYKVTRDSKPIIAELVN